MPQLLFYDFGRKAILRGDGTTSQPGTILGYIINRIAGGSNTNNTADGTPARDFALDSNPYHGLDPDATGIAISPEGKLYFTAQNKVLRVEADGRVTTVAGGGTSTTEGANAKNYVFSSTPHDLAFGLDGSLFITGHGLARPEGGKVWRMTPDGKIYSFAGGVQRTPPDYGDGGPANQAYIPDACGVAVSPDGSVYIAMRQGDRIRRVSPDGIISTFAGTGQNGFSGDNNPATSARLSFPTGLAVGPDGSVYIADSHNNRIRRVRPDGIITTVAGTGVDNFSGDGGLATQAAIYTPMDVACGADGTLYITDSSNGRIRAINPEGIIQTIVGKRLNWGWPPQYYGFVPDGSLALSADFSRLTRIAVAPDGGVYLSAQSFVWNYSIYQLTSPYPSYLASSLQIPSEDGSELYQFDANGCHLKTTDALTGTTLYFFAYDSLGNLTGVSDLDDLLTSIERDSTGKPVAIVAPFGQRTSLTVNNAGFLTEIRNEENEAHRFVYNASGLMTQRFDPKNNLYRFSYDADGRLIKEEDPAGGFKSLTRTALTNGFEVTMTTAAGQTNKYRIERLSNGGIRRTNTDAAGLATVTKNNPDGTSTTTWPDGTVSTEALGPDPRFGMQVPLAKSSTVIMPSGLQANAAHKRVITQMTGSQVTGITDTLIINGRKYLSAYDGNQKRFTFTSPEGRKTFAFINSLGRVVQDSISGITPVNYGFGSLGFLLTTAQGNRASQFTYSRGWLDSATDPLMRMTTFAYDSVGRITQQVLPGSRTIAYSYDRNGNLTSLTPPGKPAHGFDYTSVDLTQRYTPPLLNKELSCCLCFRYAFQDGLYAGFSGSDQRTY